MKSHEVQPPSSGQLNLRKDQVMMASRLLPDFQLASRCLALQLWNLTVLSFCQVGANLGQ